MAQQPTSKPGTKPNQTVVDALTTDADYVQPPAGKSDEFCALWFATVKDFPSEYFRSSDVPIIEQYVSTEVKRREVAARLDTEGLTVRSPKGMVENPLVKTLATLSGQVRSCARMLRVSPSSRYDASQVPKSKTRKEAPRDETPKGRVLRLAGKP